MPTCPECHASSAAADYCDACGASLSPPAPAPTPPAPPPAPAATACPNCGAPSFGRFCEECGHDATAPVSERSASAPSTSSGPAAAAAHPGAGAATWSAVVRADRGWFDEVRARNGPDAGTLEFPQFCPERRFPLTGPQVLVGRRSRSRGVDPQIDLTGPPLDPGVSTQHALFVPAADGTWQVVDLDSTNGTTVGAGTALIPPRSPVPLRDGDVVKIGAWTTITVVRD